MSTNNPTFPQAVHILKLVNDQNLDFEQIKKLHICLPPFLKALAAGRVDYIKLLALAEGGSEIRNIEHCIDIGVLPSIPFDASIIDAHQGKGTVTIERRDNDLYVGGKKVLLKRSPRQLVDGERSDEVQKYFKGRALLNATVLDYLLAHQYLIPDSWKFYEPGKVAFIEFRGTVYKYRADREDKFVRNLYCKRSGRWYSEEHFHRVISSLNSFTAVIED